MGPPPGWLGGFVPLRLVLVRDARRAITISDITAFRTGVSLMVTHRTRLPELAGAGGPGGFGPPGLATARLGIAFADGSKWQSGQPFFARPDTPPPAPYVQFLGGGGSRDHQRLELWVWPLPPSGPVTFAFAWPDENVDETTVDVDGDVFRTAADEAQQVWEPAGPVELAAVLPPHHPMADGGWATRLLVAKPDDDGGDEARMNDEDG